MKKILCFVVLIFLLACSSTIYQETRYSSVFNFSFEEIAETNLYPVVKIFDPVQRTSGTGTIIGNQRIDSNNIKYFVLTAKHLVENTTSLSLFMYDYIGNQALIQNVSILKMIPIYDAAILIFNSSQLYYTAIASFEEEVEIFTPVFSVASHIGSHPFLIPGIISLTFMFSDNQANHDFYLFVGESVFGNSGGPVFNYHTKELEGIIIYMLSTQVPTTTPTIRAYVPLTYVAHILKWSKIKGWLDRNGFDYVYYTEVIK